MEVQGIEVPTVVVLGVDSSDCFLPMAQQLVASHFGSWCEDLYRP